MGSGGTGGRRSRDSLATPGTHSSTGERGPPRRTPPPATLVVVRLPPDLVARLARPQGDVVTRAQLIAVGADDAWISRQVSTGRWQRLHQGVVVVHSGPVAWRSRAWGAVLYAGEGAALSHESAAYRHEFTDRAPRVVDVVVPEGRRVAPSRGLRVHVRRDVLSASGRPRTVWPGDTVVDLVAAAGSVDDAVGWACAAARAGTNPLEIADAVARRGRFRNVALLRELVAEVTQGIESPLERRYHRDVERRHGLPRSRLQVRQVIDGLWIRADVVYLGLGVRVELDGALGHPGGRTDADTWRDNAVLLATREVTLRYRWRHVAVTPCRVAVQVVGALHRGGWRATPRPCGPGCPVVERRRVSVAL